MLDLHRFFYAIWVSIMSFSSYRILIGSGYLANFFSLQYHFGIEIYHAT